jgi:hypothetical protein
MEFPGVWLARGRGALSGRCIACSGRFTGDSEHRDLRIPGAEGVGEHRRRTAAGWSSPAAARASIWARHSSSSDMGRIVQRRTPGVVVCLGHSVHEGVPGHTARGGVNRSMARVNPRHPPHQGPWSLLKPKGGCRSLGRWL